MGSAGDGFFSCYECLTVCMRHSASRARRQARQDVGPETLPLGTAIRANLGWTCLQFLAQNTLSTITVILFIIMRELLRPPLNGDTTMS